MGLWIRAYAAHRGVSHTSVRKAIASGRLTRGPDGTIDPAKADQAWVRTTDGEKAAIKAGEIPEEWKDQPARLRQKDHDARWTVNGL